MPLDDRSSRLRDQVLFPNGGWLGECVVLVSDLLGLWDIFVLMALFVVVWVVIRTTSCEISMVLGMVFDLGIPLQYQNDESLARLHARHLSEYWPVLVIASMVEVAGFFFFHPDLFTLCVCIKTTGCLALWLSRQPDGSRVVLDFRSGSDRASSGKSRGSASSQVSTANPHQGPFDPTLPDPRAPQAAAILRQAGYDQDTVEGMIVNLKRRTENDEVRKNMREWTKFGLDNPVKMAERKRKYTAKARENRAAWARLQQGARGDRGTTGRSGGSAGTSGGRNGLNGASGGTSNGRIALPKEAMDPISRAIRTNGKMDPQTKASVEDHIKQAIRAQDADALKKALRKINIHTSDPRIVGKVYGELGESEVRRRYERLRRSDHEGGLGIGHDVADVMIRQMIAQPSKQAANDLYATWSGVRQMQGREKGRALTALTQRYGRYVGEPADSKSQLLIMPWMVGWKDR